MNYMIKPILKTILVLFLIVVFLIYIIFTFNFKYSKQAIFNDSLFGGSENNPIRKSLLYYIFHSSIK